MQKIKQFFNGGLTTEFYENSSDELAPLFLHVYDFWELSTIGITSRTVIISAIYNKGDQIDIGNYRPVSLSNLDTQTIKFILIILKNLM